MDVNPDYDKNALRLALERGIWQRLDAAGRALLQLRPDDIFLNGIMGELALKLGRYSSARQFLTAAGRAFDHPAPAPTTADRYLLVPEWGYGFWSDVQHVLGSLLLARLVKRKVLVVWSDNSLFSPGGENAWDRYFEPIAQFSIDVVDRPGISVFPPPWSREDLRSKALSTVRSERPQDTFGIGLLPRNEDVLVSDTYVGVPDLLPWIEPGEPYFGEDVETVQRDLARRHLVLRPYLRDRVEGFRRQVMTGKRWLAVHFRGGDKGIEVPSLAQINAQYPDRIDAILAADPSLHIFLMTDSGPFLKEMLARYPNRLVAAAATRTWNHKGVHTAGNDPVKIAEEVILDTYVASRCDMFLGNGTSNVSLAVGFLKDWGQGDYHLLGTDRRSRRHFTDAPG